MKIRQINWVNALFLTLTPIAALILPIVYISRYGLHWLDFVVFFIMYILTGMGITAGYHRHFSHRSYDAHWAVRLFFLLFGGAAAQNSALRWCRDHRIHHQKVDDREDDPYAITRGLFWAHMGWVYFESNQDDDFTAAPDLKRDRLLVWQDKYYLPILVGVGFLLPALLELPVGRPFAGFLFGGLVRTVFVQHMTFCINSLAHYFGTRPYSVDNTARDSWWLAYLTYGEGYHNYHHRFAADYRNGIRWYHFDPTKWFINGLARFGLAWRLTQYREEHILKARIETQLKLAHAKLADAPEEFSARVRARLDAAREQLEAAPKQFDEARASYQALKKQAHGRLALARRDFEAAREEWRLRTRQYNFQFQAAQARWALLLAAVSRVHAHGHLPPLG
ncbi:MAG: fatty acid desaturase [Elusimicrobia bacterium]|nr:fatty acid desaturase [Elusimicrobiota bacterium]